MTDTVRAEVELAPPPTFPVATKCPFANTPEYDRLRATEPVSKVRMPVTGADAWIVATHELVKEVLNSPTMSSSWKNPGYPHQVPLSREFLDNVELPLLALDAPEHTVRRRLLIPEFTVKRMQELRPRMQQIVDERIDAILAHGGPVDLVQELAVPVPTLLFAELMGAPPADSAMFRAHAEATMTRGIDPDELLQLQIDMEKHLDALVTAKEQQPTEDLLSRIIARNDESDEPLAHHEMVAIARMLMFGGFDTAANMISLGTLTLLRHPEQLAQIKRDPTLTPKAVGELLRYLSINDSASGRVAVADTRIGDVLIAEGEGVVLLYGSANRDESVFPDGDTFDIHRDVRGHVAFGGGVHQCPGASLVRLELELVFNTLFARLPELRLAVPFEELSFKTDAMVYGMDELPVTWGPTS